MGEISKIEMLKQKTQRIQMGGGQGAADRQRAQGKMTARERVAKLLDPLSFTELDQFVAHRCDRFDMAGKEAPGEGVVTGYGTVGGRLVFVYAQDFTVIGGSLGEMHAAKIVKVQQMALKAGAPVIGLNDSGGARIQEGVDALSGYGKIFFNNTVASGVIPQISAIMGPSAGGAVYSPGITDFIFMVQNTSRMFITGPQVIKEATGEEVTPEALGGSGAHCARSGVAHFEARNDMDCLDKIRELLSYLPSNNMEDPPAAVCTDDRARMDEALNTLVPNNPNSSYDMLEIIRRVADGGVFFQVHALFAKNILTGFIRLGGRSVGVVANQPKHLAGCMDIDASDKAARFIRFCDAFNIPLLTLVDVPGFLPGTHQEYGGIIRHGAKVLYAFSEATVPKVTVEIRKAYGGAYIAMCCKELGADQVMAWPGAEIAVMGAEGASKIIFRKEIEASEDPDKTREALVADYHSRFATPYAAAERGYVDMVVEPKETRPRLINAFEMLAGKRETRPAKKHGNMPV
ncbi:MAG: methylmalonyl-CoA carboxyltransferase [Peptococcaceae bacterium]|nr:methylmalonyl-CoA carboxyltransferase [Peptococcaceae bacterium]